MNKIVLILIPFFFSCNMKNIPKCSDENVKKITLEILKERLKNPLIVEYSNSNFELETVESANASPSDYSFSDKQRKIAEKQANSILDKLKLSNIITLKTQDSIKKCECESHIKIEYLNNLKIKYSAQLTDEGETFVKLSTIQEE
nr:hypothetical protein [uncultured Flavobacterium sp.]